MICDTIRQYITLLLTCLGNSMKAPLYDDILSICQKIANASAQGDDDARHNACKDLQKLCATHQDTPKDHPLQWEALGDFTEEGDLAMDIYEIGLSTAEKLTLTEFTASIYLAMAQRQQEFDEADKALEFAKKAEIASATINSDELKQEITDFLAKL